MNTIRCAAVFESLSPENRTLAEKLRARQESGEICLAAYASPEPLEEMGDIPCLPREQIKDTVPEWVFYFSEDVGRTNFRKKDVLKQYIPRFLVKPLRRLEMKLTARRNRKKWDGFTGWNVPVPEPELSEGSAFSPLDDAGIPAERVIPAYVLNLPAFRMGDYVRLRELGISFLSDDCWAGLMYNTLGMEMQSPFINMFIRDGDYLRLVSDPEKYLREPLVPVNLRKATTGSRYYPVVRLGDVEMHFNHATDPQKFEEYAARWYIRRRRIRYDRLFAKFAVKDPETEEECLRVFASLPYPHLVFVPHPCAEPNTVYLEDIDKHPGYFKDGYAECVRACAKNDLPSGVPYDFLSTYLQTAKTE